MAARIRNIKIDVVSYVEPAIYNGFNIAICKNSDTPLQSSVVTKYVKPEYNASGTYTHTINNIVLDDADTYSIWVQNVGFGIDSMWRNNSGVEVPDDGVGTVASSFTPDDVQDALNEIDDTTSENVVKINPGNIGNNQINGDHIATTADIKLNEGGKLTVGQNNVILDSTENKIIIAPDNGVIIGQEDLSGVDYCELAHGDMNFMYWDGAEHKVYNSVKRVEVGTDVLNNVPLTIPGIWKQQPKIIVSPASIMTYNKNYVANQTLECRADDITKNGLSYSFTPKAFLRLTDGVVGTNISMPATASGGGRNTWYYANSASRNTPNNTTSLTVSGSVQAYSVSYWYRFNDGLPVESWGGMRCYVRVWIVVDGVERYVGEWTADQASTATWNFSTSVSGLSSGVHSYYFRVGFQRTESEGYSDILTTPWGKVLPAYETTNQSTFTSLSTGTLNYMAIGE